MHARQLPAPGAFSPPPRDGTRLRVAINRASAIRPTGRNSTEIQYSDRMYLSPWSGVALPGELRSIIGDVSRVFRFALISLPFYTAIDVPYANLTKANERKQMVRGESAYTHAHCARARTSSRYLEALTILLYP